MARADIPRLGRTRHRPDGVLRPLASLSRNIATTAAATTLAEDLPAWAIHLRSRARLLFTASDEVHSDRVEVLRPW